MKAGDLVKLNARRADHPAYKNGVLYLVSKVHMGKGLCGRNLVELYTPSGSLIAFTYEELELVCESR